MNEFEGHERRRSEISVLVAEQLREMREQVARNHTENTTATNRANQELLRRMDEVMSALHSLALTVQRGDSDLERKLAVHEAGVHPAAAARLDSLTETVDEHDTAIDEMRRRWRTEDERNEGRRWWVMAAVGVGAVASQMVGSILQAVATVIDKIAQRGS